MIFARPELGVDLRVHGGQVGRRVRTASVLEERRGVQLDVLCAVFRLLTLLNRPRGPVIRSLTAACFFLNSRRFFWPIATGLAAESWRRATEGRRT